jgi:uncharacterized membrane protein
MLRYSEKGMSMRWFTSLSRPVQVVIVFSVALNLFFVSGFIVSAVRNSQQSDSPADPSLARLIQRLPVDDAAVLREARQSKQAQLSSTRLKYQQALIDVNRALVREPLDNAELVRAVKNAGDARHAITNVRVDLYTQALPRMSIEGRKQAAASR